ncbi:hypothetical protein EVAR_38042_1 [Eumeta japonica]|uniref:Uncharacterized protein n=1 Tax=Eumeta variegata TaxID=151549 RepID=A0A4C1W7D9_EUMVA|nr:hypothetical protein EVAR_38042_1 [Eumeta japonica]
MDKSAHFGSGRNLGGSMSGHTRVTGYCAEHGAGHCVRYKNSTVLEQHTTSGQQAKAGILICRSNIAVSVLTHLSTHCLVGHVDPMMSTSFRATSSTAEAIDGHLDHLERVLNILHGKRILIGVDLRTLPL